MKGGLKNELIGGILLGLGISIRPTLIFVIPFIIALNYNKTTKEIHFQIKETFLRLVGPIFLLLISGLYFLIFPQMLTDFININLTGEFTYTTEGALEINPSFSLTRIVLIFLSLVNLDVNGFLIFLLISLLILTPIYLFFYKNSNQPISLINGYLAGILVMLIVYFDTWPHHLVVLAPFLIFFILIHKDFKFYRLLKYSYYLLAALAVVFWVIFYLTYEVFPFNIGGLILLMVVYFLITVYYKKGLN